MDRILVVDDSPVIRAMLSGWLIEAGYEVATAGSGEEGLDRIAAEPPDVVILDLLMPGMGGLELCRLLKSNESSARIPVVVLTTAGTADNRIASLELGAEDFLTKPVARAELLARVRSLVRSKHLADRLLLSYLELDKLGAFAEAFSQQNLADWTDEEMATNMAREILGPAAGTPRHPRAAWAGRREGEEMAGAAWYHLAGRMRGLASRVQLHVLQTSLQPFDRGGGQFFCKTGMPRDLAAMLGFPAELNLDNFAGLVVRDQVILVAGYPWEVGAYEIPLLRALTRHWAVFGRIRFEALQAEQAFFTTMEALALAAEFYDTETARHIIRVSAYATALARAVGCDAGFVKWLARSSQMHDVGKITIPIELIRKASPLSPEDRHLLVHHTVNGARLLGDLKPLAMARNIALSHHENFDGSGYPQGLRGEEIPLEARIVRIADVYDALRTERPYKLPFGHQAALDVLRHGDGRVEAAHFDPRLLQAFLGLEREMAQIFDRAAAGDRDLADRVGRGETLRSARMEGP